MQRNPLIKGNLLRLRHFLYQLLAGGVFYFSLTGSQLILKLWPSAQLAAIVLGIVFACLAVFMNTVFGVQRLHDAGYNGLWLLLVYAIPVLLAAATVVTFGIAARLGIDADPYFKMAWFVMECVSMIPWIIVCILPSKRENNPWI